MAICECGACGLDAGVYSTPHYINSVNVGGQPKRFIQGHAIGVAIQEGKRTRETATHCAKGHLKTEHMTDKGKCGECARIRGTKWRSDHPVERLAIARKCMYGITDEQYQELLSKQQGKCLVCKLVFSEQRLSIPCIDHDHACCPGSKSCGKCIRGVVCYGCNVMLGFAKDSITTLENAVQYLKETQQCKQNTLSELRVTAHIRMGLENPSSPELRYSAMAATTSA